MKHVVETLKYFAMCFDMPYVLLTPVEHKVEITPEYSNMYKSFNKAEGPASQEFQQEVLLEIESKSKLEFY